MPTNIVAGIAASVLHTNTTMTTTTEATAIILPMAIMDLARARVPARRDTALAQEKDPEKAQEKALGR